LTQSYSGPDGSYADRSQLYL